MKIRNGFVSNSSSSSFIIGKYFMTEEQQELFREGMLKIEQEYEYSEYGSDLSELEHYFAGTVDGSICTKYFDLLEEIGVDRSKAGCIY